MDSTHDHFMPLREWLRCTARVVITCVLGLTSGCHSWQKSHEAAVAQFGHGDIEVSRLALQESREKLRSEKKVLELDSGILDLASGNVLQAESRFRTIRRELEHLEQKDVTEQATSMMTDARAVAYSGRDFERRMVLNMALLTSLLGDGQDAFAYTMQVTEAAASRKVAISDAAKKTSESNALAESVPEPGAVAQVTPASYATDRNAAICVPARGTARGRPGT